MGRVKAFAHQRVMVNLGYSEVLCHLRVAGTEMRVRVLPDGAQLMDDDGRDLSFPITHTEAGIEYLGMPQSSDHFKCSGMSVNFDSWHCYTHNIFNVCD